MGMTERKCAHCGKVISHRKHAMVVFRHRAWHAVCYVQSFEGRECGVPGLRT